MNKQQAVLFSVLGAVVACIVLSVVVPSTPTPTPTPEAVTVDDMTVSLAKQCDDTYRKRRWQVFVNASKKETPWESENDFAKFLRESNDTVRLESFQPLFDRVADKLEGELFTDTEARLQARSMAEGLPP